MKKYLLLPLISAFMIILGASAQSNSYNMVIEMANGVKINIGPNEIKNITFLDGQLTINGESIDDIIKKLARQKDEIEIMNSKTDELQKTLATLSLYVKKDDIVDIQKDVLDRMAEYLKDYVKKGEVETADLDEVKRLITEALKDYVKRGEGGTAGLAESDVKWLIEEALKDYTKTSEMNIGLNEDNVNNLIESALKDYVKWSMMPSLDGYVKTADQLDAIKALLSDYYTRAEVEALIKGINIPEGLSEDQVMKLIDDAFHNVLADYAKKTDIPTIFTKAEIVDIVKETVDSLDKDDVKKLIEDALKDYVRFKDIPETLTKEEVIEIVKETFYESYIIDEIETLRKEIDELKDKIDAIK